VVKKRPPVTAGGQGRRRTRQKGNPSMNQILAKKPPDFNLTVTDITGFSQKMSIRMDFYDRRRILVKEITRFYEDPKNRQEFNEWLLTDEGQRAKTILEVDP